MTYQPFEGDSVALDPTSPFFLDHVTRYWWAAGVVREMRVLDCACGHGYGSYILAKNAREAVGVDLNAKSLDEARRIFQAPNLRYVEHDVLALDQLTLGGKFDCVVAFEVIEHLPQDATHQFLASIAQLLSPGGILLLSTPNHDVVLKSGVEVPGFHINNWKPKELRSVLQRHFREVVMLGQFCKRGGVNKIVFDLDFWNFRHVVGRSLKVLSNHASKTTAASVIASASQSTAAFNPLLYFRAPPAEYEWYRFSEHHWRQAGLTLAVCASPFFGQEACEGGARRLAR